MNSSPLSAAREALVDSPTELVASTSNFGAGAQDEDVAGLVGHVDFVAGQEHGRP